LCKCRLQQKKDVISPFSFHNPYFPLFKSRVAKLFLFECSRVTLAAKIADKVSMFCAIFLSSIFLFQTPYSLKKCFLA